MHEGKKLDGWIEQHDSAANLREDAAPAGRSAAAGSSGPQHDRKRKTEMRERSLPPGRHFWLGLLLMGAHGGQAAQPPAPHAGHTKPAAGRPAKPQAEQQTPGGKPARPAPGSKANDPHAGHAMPGKMAPGARDLPPLPRNLPAWLENKQTNHIFYKRGPYNFAIYNVKPLARDLNAVAAGHSTAYEDMVTGKTEQLDTHTFFRINRILKNPPKFMPDEAAIGPTFVRRYGVLELMFDWAHTLHAQTVDVLASKKMSQSEKDREIEALYRFYTDNAPWIFTPLPMNMAYLDNQPYSKTFRTLYPRVNGLFWGYHWLQGTMYDVLDGKSLEEQRSAYEPVRRQYHEIELYRTDRMMMPMFAELSPGFAGKFPDLSNTFDNLHMLHDMVNDILASDWIPEEEKDRQIKRAMWMVSASAHEGEKPGDAREPGGLHDHRFMPGTPGMGMMPQGHGAHSMPAKKHAPEGAGAPRPRDSSPGADPHRGHTKPDSRPSPPKAAPGHGPAGRKHH